MCECHIQLYSNLCGSQASWLCGGGSESCCSNLGGRYPTKMDPSYNKEGFHWPGHMTIRLVGSVARPTCVASPLPRPTVRSRRVLRTAALPWLPGVRRPLCVAIPVIPTISLRGGSHHTAARAAELQEAPSLLGSAGALGRETHRAVGSADPVSLSFVGGGRRLSCLPPGFVSHLLRGFSMATAAYTMRV